MSPSQEGTSAISRTDMSFEAFEFEKWQEVKFASKWYIIGGTIIGAIFSYILMNSVTTNQREILISIEGTNIWSGQGPQTYDSQAIAWGAKDIFLAGGTYQWVTYAFLIGFTLPVPFWIAHKYFPKIRWHYWNTAIIANFTGLLYVWINSVTMPWFYVGVVSQWYLRQYRPNWFIKYNYVLSAALDGGTQVMVFILSFAVQGGAGNPFTFPPYWGKAYNKGNLDYCMQNPYTANS